ncbi:D-alanyl-D-alanine carboxypeptidase [Cohnella sp. LGH]|uniref:D-alanyl-D-alanine carboxypeptidase family protein n=1 Tax=Cohnella sp. LGH TaxID=1619153 RepID=UPI001ADBAB75|nr:D-alanyl-D-alanine carboxypeptidase family protein [Cohnella sp. LGH]QTH44804.1 D-alanyl-D-alanine carboxypeptidase [Cohnella sp. LGH]
MLLFLARRFNIYRLYVLSICLTIAAALSASSAAGAARPSEKPPANQAKAAALADVASGRILYSQHGDEPMKIASLTKIMTAIVAIEHGNLEDKVKVSKRAAGKEGSSLYLKAGETITLRNALYGLMLRSGNDAAIAIAEHVGGSVEGFAFLMNKKAEELGLENSHFMNPHGLDEPGHHSSANDLAKLAVYALRNPEFKKIVGTQVRSAPNPNDSWDYKWVNKNKMLQMYEGADGVKTGYTKQALRTLVSSATRGGQQLVAVTLNDRDDWKDHASLLDYGFARFPLVRVVGAGEPLKEYPFETAEGFAYPFAEEERERLEIRLVPLNPESVQYRLGYRGQLKFMLDGRQVGGVPLVADAEREASTPKSGQAQPQADRPSVAATASQRTFGTAFQTVLKALLLQGGE